MAARLERRPIVMPHKCKTVEEWLGRYRRNGT